MSTTSKFAAMGIAALALIVIPASPAVAASQQVRAKAVHGTSTYEGYYTVITIQYSCPTGKTATVFASISQADTGAYYDSSWRSSGPDLTCDGKKHTMQTGLVSLGYTEEDSHYVAPYLEDTALGYDRGVVSVTVTCEGRSATDATRVIVQNRDA